MQTRIIDITCLPVYCHVVSVFREGDAFPELLAVYKNMQEAQMYLHNLCQFLHKDIHLKTVKAADGLRKEQQYEYNGTVLLRAFKDTSFSFDGSLYSITEVGALCTQQSVYSFNLTTILDIWLSAYVT